jgi:hypothetical protein
LDLGPPLLIMVSFINFAHVLFFGNGAFYNRLFMALDPLYLRREREREREREIFYYYCCCCYYYCYSSKKIIIITTAAEYSAIISLRNMPCLFHSILSYLLCLIILVVTSCPELEELVNYSVLSFLL